MKMPRCASTHFQLTRISKIPTAAIAAKSNMRVQPLQGLVSKPPPVINADVSTQTELFAMARRNLAKYCPNTRGFSAKIAAGSQVSSPVSQDIKK
jgi:hypothetical protein